MKNNSKQKLHELINNLSIFTTNFYRALLNLSSSIHEIQNEFTSEQDIIEILIEIFSKHLPKDSSNSFSILISEGGKNLDKFFDIAQQEMIKSDIVDYFSSLPNQYLVNFNMVNITNHEQLDKKINNYANFKFERKSEISSLANKDKYFLKIEMRHNGYLARNRFEEPFSKLKQIIYLGSLTNLFSINKKRIYLYKESNSKLSEAGLFGKYLEKEGAYFVNASTQNSEEKEINLPDNYREHIYQTEFNKDILPTEKQKKIADFIHTLELLNTGKKETVRILNAMEWAYEADLHQNDPLKTILKCTAIEAITGGQNQEKTSQFSTKCAYQLARSHKERAEIFEKTNALYKLRSDLVHGTQTKLTPQNRQLLMYADGLFRQLITSELKLLTYNA
jgi:hypothetical protein